MNAKGMENLRKVQSLGLVILLQVVAVAGLSCRNERSAAENSIAQTEKPTGEKIAEADQLYSQRDDLAKIRLGVALLRQARITEYGNYEIAWKLARICYYLGAHTEDSRERDEAFREGTEAGETAVKLNSERPEGHFWLGANYGGSAEHDTLAGLTNIEDIRREMEAVLKIDERFQAGSAYMALGQLYLQAPRLFGGDARKALEYLEKGLSFGSDNALLRFHLAEAYHEVNRNAEARKQIDVLFKMTPHPDYVPEYKEAVDKAKKLLQKMDRTERQ